MRRSGPEIVLQVLALLQAAQLVVQRGDCRLRGLLRGRLYLDGLAGRRRGGHWGQGGELARGGLRPFQGTVGHTVGHQPLPSSSIEHRLDVLPGVHDLVVRVSQQPNVPAPGVEVCSVWLDVLPALCQPVGVKHKLQSQTITNTDHLRPQTGVTEVKNVW